MEPSVRPRVLWQLGKHQLGQLAAWLLDLLVMVALVELLRLSPVTATIIGAAVGAITSFMLGRHWTFRASAGRAHAQALRYAAVSAASLGLNAAAMHLATKIFVAPYLISRLGIAIAVSVGWNFPLHRWFVFATPRDDCAPTIAPLDTPDQPSRT